MGRKKKVLFLLEAFDKGGIEKVTLDIVNNLDPEKYDITVQTFWYGGHCQNQVKSHIKVIPFFFRRYVRGIIRLIAYLPPKLLYQLFVHGKYDIEIACSDGGAAKVISGSTNPHSRKICWVHMDVVERGSKLKEFVDAKTANRIYSRFDLIVPVSEACKIKFETKFGCNYPIQVVRNPMPVADILRKSNAFQPDFSRRETTFVCIGRLVEQKGFDRLIHVAYDLKTKLSRPFHIYIIGDGPERETLETTISDLDLNNEITMLGFKDNPYPYLKQADWFLLPSRDEAFPLVVGESLIVGTPVIATDCSGVREWLKNDYYGKVLSNSSKGILSGMEQVLIDPEILIKYRCNASEALQEISFENGLLEFEAILR